MYHCRGTPSLSALASPSFLSSSGKVVSSNLNTFLCVYGVKMTCCFVGDGKLTWFTRDNPSSGYWSCLGSPSFEGSRNTEGHALHSVCCVIKIATNTQGKDGVVNKPASISFREPASQLSLLSLCQEVKHSRVSQFQVFFQTWNIHASGMCHYKGSAVPSPASASPPFLAYSGKPVSSNLNTFLFVYSVKRNVTCCCIIEEKQTWSIRDHPSSGDSLWLGSPSSAALEVTSLSTVCVAF